MNEIYPNLNEKVDVLTHVWGVYRLNACEKFV